MLTTFQDDTYLAEAIQAGAQGYLLKHQSAEAVMHGIRSALSGNVSFEPGVARSLSVCDTTRDEAFLEGLPPRAIDVLRNISRGCSNREIADELHLSEGTVRNYVSELLQFADVRDRTQLVIWYYRSGPFDP
jgi:DNA-binding NarL/FixJ family response regulator